MFSQFSFEIAPGLEGIQPVEAPGNYFRCVEADYPFEISFDNSPWAKMDVGMDIRDTSGKPIRFQRFAIRHFGAGIGNFIFNVAENMTMNDGRLTISESRNGSAASYTPPNIAEVVSTEGVGGAVTGVWIELLPYEAGREEVWLTTDAAAAAHWNFEDAGGLTAARNLFPTAGEGRWLKLRTKSAIYCRHSEAGKSVTALSFTY